METPNTTVIQARSGRFGADVAGGDAANECLKQTKWLVSGCKEEECGGTVEV